MQEKLCNLDTVNSEVSPGTSLIGELASIGQTVSFGAGERVIREGELGKGIYILRAGSARVSMASHDGKTIELYSLERGGFIGLSSTLSCDHCCYTVETGEHSDFTFVPSAEAQELLRLRPDLCLQVIQLLGKEMSAVCNERALLNANANPVQIGTLLQQKW
jgi:CRP-like cAMP-binding protein